MSVQQSIPPFIRYGTVFPTTPPHTNYPFYRSDLGVTCWWDGTRWLGEEEALVMAFRAATAFGTNGLNPATEDYVYHAGYTGTRNILLTRWIMDNLVFNNNSGNSASHYWVIELRRTDNNSNIATMNTSAQGTLAWVPQLVTSFTSNPYSPSVAGFEVRISKGAGTPGGLYPMPQLFGRQVYT